MKDNYNKGYKKIFYQIRLGIEKLFNYPFLNFIWFFVFTIVILLINGKQKFSILFDIPLVLKDMVDMCMSFLIVAIPIIVSLGIIQAIGYITARKDETNLILAFDEKDLKNGCPILIHKKVLAKKGIIIREFFTNIPKAKWDEKRDAICDIMDIHIIGDFSYGGRKKNKGNRIYFESANSRLPKDRGALYDEFE